MFRPRVPIARWAILWALINPIALGGEGQIPPKSFEVRPVALTFSGGVSLGSYQAGLAYTLVRHFRMHRTLEDAETGQPAKVQPYATSYGGLSYDLEAVTGTSAGAGNAVATAVTWCASQGDADGFRTSVHHSMWQPMSIESFLPADPEKYRLDDGLMSSLALIPATAATKQSLYQQAMRPGCQVPLGLALTRGTPTQIKVGDTLKISTSAYLGSYSIRARDDGSMSLSRFPLPDNESLLARELIPPQRNGEVNKDFLVHSILASGSIPTMFAPQILGHCVGDEEVPPGESYPEAPGCPEHAPFLRQDSFVDGGLFDRIPLALTVAYLDDQKLTWEDGHRGTLNYITVDPTRVRFETLQREETSVTSQGIAALLAFTGDFVMVARQQQLHSLFSGRSLNNEEEQLVELNRGFPVLGRYLGNFGAFMDPGFREYDYFTGVYEGLRYLAQEAWQRRASLGKTKDFPQAKNVGSFDCMAPIESAPPNQGVTPRSIACMVPYFAVLGEDLGLDRDPEASGLIRNLLIWEMERSLPSVEVEQILAVQDQWPFNPNDTYSQSPFELIVETLKELDHAHKSEKISTDLPAYLEVMNSLKEKGYPFESKDLEHDPEAYLYRLLRRSLARLEGLERESHPGRGVDKTLGQRVSLGMLRAASAAVPAPPAPRHSLERKRSGAEQLLPNYLDLNLIQGGVNVGFEAPVMLFGEGAALLSAEPITWRRGSGIGWQLSAEAGWYNPYLSRVSGIYAGSFLQGSYREDATVDFGVRVSSRFFANRLQVGVEVPLWQLAPGMPRPEDGGFAFEITVGVVDIRGLNRLDNNPLQNKLQKKESSPR